VPLAIPRNLVEAAELDGRQAWLATLPATVKGAQQRWSLEHGEPFQPGGRTAWVAPARGDAGEDMVLKVAWRHAEAMHEADGLRAWNGGGAAQREPWLVIDPKPYVGDPTYDPLQHLLNCDERFRLDPRGLAHRMADLLGLDRQRLLRWLFARCVQESPEWPGLAEVARRIAPT